jgi:hypothetical protein
VNRSAVWLLAIAALAACEGRAPADEPAPHANATAARPKPVRVDSVSGVGECEALLAAYDSLTSCGSLAPDVRNALGDGIEQVRHGLRQLKDAPPERKRQAALECDQAHDAVKQAAREAGCRPPTR